MSGEDRDDELANRRNAILMVLLGLPTSEATGLLAESICAVLHDENIKPRSPEYIAFEATLTRMISGRLEAMEGESRTETSDSQVEQELREQADTTVH